MNDSKSAREQAITRELDNSYDSLIQMKDHWLAIRVQFEAARTRYSGASSLASQMLSGAAWWEWLENHPDVRYMGKSMGDAIKDVLKRHADQRAARNAKLQVAGANVRVTDYWACMNLDELTRELENGGFEFKSLTPAREVNAALMRLEGVKKRAGMYEIENAEKILERNVEWATDAARAEEDVPF